MEMVGVSIAAVGLVWVTGDSNFAWVLLAWLVCEVEGGRKK